jgi:hypothetical protein
MVSVSSYLFRMVIELVQMWKYGFVSSYLLGMVVELLQMQKYGFCFLPSFGYDS